MATISWSVRSPEPGTARGAGINKQLAVLLTSYSNSLSAESLSGSHKERHQIRERPRKCHPTVYLCLSESGSLESLYLRLLGPLRVSLVHLAQVVLAVTAPKLDTSRI